MTVHRPHVVLAAVLVGIGALIPQEACTGPQQTPDEQQVLAETQETPDEQRALAEAQETPNEQQVLAQGEAAEQYGIGYRYWVGQGVPQDDAAAGRWYLLAAEQGHAAAQGQLGLMTANGWGVRQDDTEELLLALTLPGIDAGYYIGVAVGLRMAEILRGGAT